MLILFSWITTWIICLCRSQFEVQRIMLQYIEINYRHIIQKLFYSPIYKRNNWSNQQDFLNKHNIWTIFKPPRKIEQILKNLKIEDLHLVLQYKYKISCFYGKIYIDETGKIVNMRIKEHQQNVRLKSHNHHWQRWDRISNII